MAVHPESRQPDSMLTDDEHPWPGLSSFREQDRAYFKGRDRDVEELLCLVNRERLTVLFGVSGLGKSSLLQAGLFPRLRQADTLPIMVRLDFKTPSASLDDQVFAAIQNQALENGIEPPSRSGGESLWEYFHRRDAEFWDSRNRLTLPILCFDQFEELFTLGCETADTSAASAFFLAELADLVEGRCPDSVKTRFDTHPHESKRYRFSQHPYKLIVSLREDYLANLEQLRESMPAVAHNRMRLLPMAGDQALAVADQTQGRLMDAGVAESIVRLVAGKRGEQALELRVLRIEPALLSLVCRELNELRIAKHADKIDASDVASNREQILEDFYQRCLLDQSPALRHFIEDELITVSGYRNSEAYDNALQTPGVTVEALAALVQRRLLVLRQEERDGVKRIELIHDVLTGVVRKSRDQRQQRERQQQAEQRERATREALIRSKQRTAVFVVLACFFLLTAAWGWWNWWEAKTARNITLSGKLAAQAILLAETVPNDTMTERAAALAIESWRLQHNAEATAAARKLLRMLPAYRFPHPDEVTDIEFSPNGRLLATGSKDRRVRVFDTAHGKESWQIEHNGSVTDLAFSPDGRLLATACSDKNLRLFDVASRHEVLRFMHDDEVRRVIFAPDGRLLATTSQNSARLIDSATGQVATQIEHGDEIKNIAFSPDSRLWATAGKKGARVFDVSGNERVKLALNSEATHVAFSPDGRSLATASLDNTVRLLDAGSGKLIRQISHRSKVSSIAFNPDGRWLATASNDQSVRVTEINSGATVKELLFNDEVFSVRFSQDGHWLATSDWGGAARLFDTASWREVTRMMHGAAVWDLAFSPDSHWLATDGMDNVVRIAAASHYPEDVILRHNAAVMGLAFASDGRWLATASADHTARLFDIANGRELMRIEHADTVYSVAISPDRQFVATASRDKTARLVNRDSGNTIATIRHGDGVLNLAFSANSRWLATASVDKSAIIIDTAGNRIKTVSADDEIRSLSFSFDNRWLAIASRDGSIQLLKTDTWKLAQRLQLAAPVTHVAFSLDSQRLLAASEDKTARIFDVHSGKEQARFAHPDVVLSLAMSPNGKLLVTSSMDGSARLFDLPAGALIATIKHGAAITALNFSPTGRFLATASKDNTTRLIESDSGLTVDTSRHADEVWAIAFSPDESILAAGVSNGQVQLQRTDPQQIFDSLCRKAGRNLSPDELSDYLGLAVPHQTCKQWREASFDNGQPGH